jgi:hypothetical protein
VELKLYASRVSLCNTNDPVTLNIAGPSSMASWASYHVLAICLSVYLFFPTCFFLPTVTHSPYTWVPQGPNFPPTLNALPRLGPSGPTHEGLGVATSSSHWISLPHRLCAPTGGGHLRHHSQRSAAGACRRQHHGDKRLRTRRALQVPRVVLRAHLRLFCNWQLGGMAVLS